MASSTARSPKALSRRLREDQSGAIMVLAMAFVFVIVIIAWALTDLAYTGSSSLRAYRLERERRYAADGAMQAAVQMARLNTQLGISTSPPACSMTMPINEDTAGGATIQVFTAGSTLSVSCFATPGVTNSGDIDPDEGGQLTRDVSFTVSCNYNPPMPAHGTLTCGSGSSTLLLGRARVRYDIDYGIVPTLPNCGPMDPNFPLVNLCRASTVRAVVPKIVYWSLKG